jgi:ethanolamine ammonia-lyase small subunit
MQIRRLLDDRDVFVGDRLFDAQGRSYAFVEHAGGKLVVTAEDERPTLFKPEQLGCYVIYVNRTERGLAKERLRDYWEG